MYLWKSHVCTNRLVLQEADGCVTQHNRSRSNLSRRRPKIGRSSCADIVGLGDSSVGLSSWENTPCDTWNLHLCEIRFFRHALRAVGRD